VAEFLPPRYTTKLVAFHLSRCFGEIVYRTSAMARRPIDAAAD